MADVSDMEQGYQFCIVALLSMLWMPHTCQIKYKNSIELNCVSFLYFAYRTPINLSLL